LQAVDGFEVEVPSAHRDVRHAGGRLPTLVWLGTFSKTFFGEFISTHGILGVNIEGREQCMIYFLSSFRNTNHKSPDQAKLQPIALTLFTSLGTLCPEHVTDFNLSIYVGIV
jgi:hypothetical protein